MAAWITAIHRLFVSTSCVTNVQSCGRASRIVSAAPYRAVQAEIFYLLAVITKPCGRIRLRWYITCKFY